MYRLNGWLLPEDYLKRQVKAIVDEQVKGPFLGLFGPGDRVNVLKLNVALDEARKTAENR